MIFKAPAEIGIVAKGVCVLMTTVWGSGAENSNGFPLIFSWSCTDGCSVSSSATCALKSTSVGRERMAVGEFRAAPEVECPREPVCGHLPRLGDHRHRLLPGVVVVNEEGEEIVIGDVGR